MFASPLRVSWDTFFTEWDGKTLPMCSCLLFHFSLCSLHRKCVNAFYSLPKHSGLNFFSAAFFKRFDFLSEAFELYQHGPFKNWMSNHLGWFFFSCQWTVTYRWKSLTSSNKPFSLNSLLWINLSQLTVNVVHATRKHPWRGWPCSPGPAAIHSQGYGGEQRVSKALFLSQLL